MIQHRTSPPKIRNFGNYTMPSSGTTEEAINEAPKRVSTPLKIRKTSQSISKSTRKSRGNNSISICGTPTTKSETESKRKSIASSVTTESPTPRIWRTLLHNGVSFPRRYLPHKVPMEYDGKYVFLGPWAEELASMFAVLDERLYSQNATFAKNFMGGLRRALKKEKSPEIGLITEFDKCDFSMIKDHVKKCGMRYEKETVEDESLWKRCRFAIVDGSHEYVCGFDIPPPAIVINQGEKSGLVHDRLSPEDITINIGEESPPPPCPVDGHDWGRVVHEQNELWVASWVNTAYGVDEYAIITGKKVGKMDGKNTPYSVAMQHLGKPEEEWPQNSSNGDDDEA